MFSLRIVNVDSYQSAPTKGYDICYSEFRGCEIFKVPIIRIFGITPSGQKGCLHVHGVFPYFSIRCKDVFPNIEAKSLRKCLQELAFAIDKALNVASRNSNSHRHRVYKIVVTEQIPFYGFHEKAEEFLKIYFYNPFDISRTAELMTNSVILNKFIQPYEAHIPYILQFFIDYNLFGMNLIKVSKFKFRASEEDFVSPLSPLRNQNLSHITLEETVFPSNKVWNVATLSSSQISNLPRQTICELELDCCSSEIMNRLNESFSSGKNPGLLAIWEEERQRRKAENDISTITPAPSQERNEFFETESENFYKKKLRKILESFDMYKGDSKEKYENSLNDMKDHLPSSDASDLSTTQDEELLNMMLSMVNRQSIQLDDDSILGLNHHSESIDDETMEMSQLFTGELEEEIWSSQLEIKDEKDFHVSDNDKNSASTSTSAQSVISNETTFIPQIDGAFDEDCEKSDDKKSRKKKINSLNTVNEFQTANEASLIKSCSLMTPVIQLTPAVIIKTEIPSPSENGAESVDDSKFFSTNYYNSESKKPLQLCVPVSSDPRCSLIMNIYENSNDVTIEHTCESRNTTNTRSLDEYENPSDVVFELITTLVYKVECLTDGKRSCYEHLTEEYKSEDERKVLAERLNENSKSSIEKKTFSKLKETDFSSHQFSLIKKEYSNETNYSLPLKKRVYNYNWERKEIDEYDSCQSHLIDFSKIGKEVVVLRKLTESDFVNNVKLNELKVVIPPLPLSRDDILNGCVLKESVNIPISSSSISSDSTFNCKKLSKSKNNNCDSNETLPSVKVEEGIQLRKNSKSKRDLISCLSPNLSTSNVTPVTNIIEPNCTVTLVSNDIENYKDSSHNENLKILDQKVNDSNSKIKDQKVNDSNSKIKDQKVNDSNSKIKDQKVNDSNSKIKDLKAEEKKIVSNCKSNLRLYRKKKSTENNFHCQTTEDCTVDNVIISPSYCIRHESNNLVSINILRENSKVCDAQYKPVDAISEPESLESTSCIPVVQLEPCNDLINKYCKDDSSDSDCLIVGEYSPADKRKERRLSRRRIKQVKDPILDSKTTLNENIAIEYKNKNKKVPLNKDIQTEVISNVDINAPHLRKRSSSFIASDIKNNKRIVKRKQKYDTHSFGRRFEPNIINSYAKIDCIVNKDALESEYAVNKKSTLRKDTSCKLSLKLNRKNYKKFPQKDIDSNDMSREDNILRISSSNSSSSFDTQKEDSSEPKSLLLTKKVNRTVSAEKNLNNYSLNNTRIESTSDINADWSIDNVPISQFKNSALKCTITKSQNEGENLHFYTCNKSPIPKFKMKKKKVSKSMNIHIKLQKLSSNPDSNFKLNNSVSTKHKKGSRKLNRSFASAHDIKQKYKKNKKSNKYRALHCNKSSFKKEQEYLSSYRNGVIHKSKSSNKTEDMHKPNICQTVSNYNFESTSRVETSDISNISSYAEENSDDSKRSKNSLKMKFKLKRILTRSNEERIVVVGKELEGISEESSLEDELPENYRPESPKNMLNDGKQSDFTKSLGMKNIKYQRDDFSLKAKFKCPLHIHNKKIINKTKKLNNNDNDRHQNNEPVEKIPRIVCKRLFSNITKDFLPENNDYKNPSNNLLSPSSSVISPKKKSPLKNAECVRKELDELNKMMCPNESVEMKSSDVNSNSFLVSKINKFAKNSNPEDYTTDLPLKIVDPQTHPRLKGSKSCTYSRSINLKGQIQQTATLHKISMPLSHCKLRERKASKCSEDLYLEHKRHDLSQDKINIAVSCPKLIERRASTGSKNLNLNCHEIGLSAGRSNESLAHAKLRERKSSACLYRRNSLKVQDFKKYFHSDIEEDSTNSEGKPSCKTSARRNSLKVQDFKKYFHSENEDSVSPEGTHSQEKKQYPFNNIILTCKPCIVKLQRLSSFEIEKYMHKPSFKYYHSDMIVACEPTVLNVPSPVVDSKGADIDPTKLLENLFNFPLACNSPLKYNKFEASPLTFESEKSLEPFPNENSDKRTVPKLTSNNLENQVKKPKDVFKSLERDDMGILWNLGYLSPVSVDSPLGSPPSCSSPTQNTTGNISEKNMNYVELDDLQRLACKANKMRFESNNNLLQKICSSSFVKDVSINLMESDGENSLSIFNESIMSSDIKTNSIGVKGNNTCTKSSKISFQNILKENKHSNLFSFDHKSPEIVESAVCKNVASLSQKLPEISLPVTSNTTYSIDPESPVIEESITSKSMMSLDPKTINDNQLVSSQSIPNFNQTPADNKIVELNQQENSTANEDPVFEPIESLPNVRILDFQECLVESDSEMNPLLNDSEIDAVMNSANMLLSDNLNTCNYEHYNQADLLFEDSNLSVQTKPNFLEEQKNDTIDSMFINNSVSCLQKTSDLDLACNDAIITAADTSSLLMPSFKNNTIPVLSINKPIQDGITDFTAIIDQNLNPEKELLPVVLATVPTVENASYLETSTADMKEGSSDAQDCVNFLDNNELLQSCSVSSTSDIENRNIQAANVVGIPFNGEEDILSMIIKSCDIGEEFDVNINSVDEAICDDISSAPLSNNMVENNQVVSEFIINSQTDKTSSFNANSENAVSSSSENNALSQKPSSELVVIKTEPLNVPDVEYVCEYPLKNNFNCSDKGLKPSEVLSVSKDEESVLLDSMIHSFYGEDSLYGLQASVSCDNLSLICPTFQSSLSPQNIEINSNEQKPALTKSTVKTEQSSIEASSFKSNNYPKILSELLAKPPMNEHESLQLKSVTPENKVPANISKPLLITLPFQKVSTKRFRFCFTPLTKPPTREMLETCVTKSETNVKSDTINDDSLSSDSSTNSQTCSTDIPQPNVFNKTLQSGEFSNSKKFYLLAKNTSHLESKSSNISPILYKDSFSKFSYTDNLISTPSTSSMIKGLTLPDVVSPINKETVLISDTSKRKRKLVFEDDSKGPLKVFKPEREQLLTVFNKYRGHSSLKESLDTLGNYSFSQIEGPTLENSRGFKVGSDNYGDAQVKHEVQHLTVMSLEIHVNTRNDLRPDPKFDSVTAIFYCIYNDIGVSEEEDIIGMIVVDPSLHHQVSGQNSSNLLRNYLLLCPGVKNGFIYSVENELALFEKLIGIIRKWDPDILTGYEIQMSSWGYLVERAEILNINFRVLISRLVDKNEMKIVQVEADHTVTDQTADLSRLNITGRIMLCIWRLMRTEVTLNIYTFENVYYHVLHKRTPLYTFHDLTNWFLGSQKEKVIRYYVIRVQGCIQFLEKLDVIGRTSELARLFGIQFYEVLSRGSQFRVESMMLRTAAPMSYIPVSPSVRQRSHSRAPECVPLILEPESRFYIDPVVVLDFQSLYPSMIIAYNYCFSTCLGRVEHFGKNVPFEFGCTSLSVPIILLQKLQNDIHISPTGIAFVKSSVRQGILPSMLEEILSTRVMVKQSMKKIKDNGALKKLLDARQMGLKLIANVTYGYTGANFSGRMPSVEVADSIVGKARETLERAIHMIENTSKWRAKIVYGDTDSLFILLPGRNKKQAFEIGQEIADAVTSDNPKPVKLKFEKVYLPCVLQTKKRYVGFMYETADQEKPVFDAKGIETVRRDSCPATAKILEKSLKILFNSYDVSLVKSYVQKQFSKLLSGHASIIDCIFAKEYRGISGYKPGACVPALEIAKKRLSKDPRSEPRVGERVPYVVVYGFPGLPIIQLVREPIDLLKDVNLRLNASYYITRVISPPLERVFNLLSADVKSWYTNLSRNFKPTLPMTRTTNNLRGTLSQYFASQSCPSCEKPTFSAVCDECREDLQGTTVTLNEKIRHWERTVDHVTQICGSCTKSGSSVDHCVSVDCPMLFKLNMAKKDLSQAPYLRKVLAHELF